MGVLFIGWRPDDVTRNEIWVEICFRLFLRVVEFLLVKDPLDPLWTPLRSRKRGMGPNKICRTRNSAVIT